jgi:putative restriction endonuclease
VLLLRIDVPTVGYRSAFIGAVLRELAGVVVLRSPQRLVVEHGAYEADARIRELARREAMWQELCDGEGAESASPAELRRLGIYGGASGIWVDKANTGRVAEPGGGVAVSVLHTGRRYPDDLSDVAMLYHYPVTHRPEGRDRAEVEALKACGRLQLPLFTITEVESGSRRRARRGWIDEWDDESAQVLVSFEAEPPSAEPPEDEPFSVYGDREMRRSTVARRPNQQRFRMGVLKRYGCRCAMCDVAAPELIKAAHLVAHGKGGSDDPRNGLPLCANHHDAVDKGLVEIDPESFGLSCTGPYEAAALGLTRVDLRHLKALPHPDALRELRRRGRISEAG